MIVLTPAERRAGLLLVVLLALGAVSDLWGGRGAVRGLRSATHGDTASIAGRETREPAPAFRATEAAAATLDLNRATARELDDLPGVGPVLAARILEHRRRYGSFHAIEDLRAVRGIGPRLFERLKSRVRVDSAPHDARSAEPAPPAATGG